MFIMQFYDIKTKQNNFREWHLYNISMNKTKLILEL